jgi:hypothetical protein
MDCEPRILQKIKHDKSRLIEVFDCGCFPHALKCLVNHVFQSFSTESSQPHVLRGRKFINVLGEQRTKSLATAYEFFFKGFSALYMISFLKNRLAQQ